MKICISKREQLTFVPSGQDDVAAEDRFTLHAEPLSRLAEESILNSIELQNAAGAQATGSAALINKVYAEHVTGWSNTGLEWQEEYRCNLPDDVVVGTPYSVRAEFFAHMLNQAGMRGEVEVGESE